MQIQSGAAADAGPGGVFNWTRPSARPAFPGFSVTTEAIFLVQCDAAYLMDPLELVSTAKAAIVVVNLTTSQTSTVANKINVVSGFNWISVQDTATSYAVPALEGSPAERVVLEMYTKHTSASFAVRPASFTWVNLTSTSPALVNNTTSSIDYFVYEGIKTSWNYYFSGIHGLKSIKITYTGTGIVTVSGCCKGCFDLRMVEMRTLAGTFNLGTGFTNCRIHSIGVYGTVSVLTNFLARSVVRTAFISGQVTLTASTTLMANTDFLLFSVFPGIDISGYTLTWDLARCSLLSIALGAVVAQPMLGTPIGKVASLSLGQLSNYTTIQGLLSQGFSVTLV
jgi:hypothetical protein